MIDLRDPRPSNGPNLPLLISAKENLEESHIMDEDVKMETLAEAKQNIEGDEDEPMGTESGV